MKYARKDFATAIELLMLDYTIRSVTVFCSPLSDVKQRIRVTRRSKNELVVTYGKPNFEEREFLKMCKKAKTQPRKVWIHFFPKKK